MSRYSNHMLACSTTACLLVSATVATRGGDAGPPGHLETGNEISRSATNTFGRPIVYTNRLSLTLGPDDRSSWSAGYDTNRVWTNDVPLVAQSGNAEAQVRLAKCLHDGTHGFPTNAVQAYALAAIAASQGQDEAKHLVEQWQATMSAKDIAAGKAAAAALAHGDRKKQR
jgi:hypothetical protein